MMMMMMMVMMMMVMMMLMMMTMMMMTEMRMGMNEGLLDDRMLGDDDSLLDGDDADGNDDGDCANVHHPGEYDNVVGWGRRSSRHLLIAVSEVR